MSFISDTFSTVASTADLSTDSAVAWSPGTGAFTFGGTHVADSSNRIFCSSTNSGNNSAWYVAKTATPASADYTIVATLAFLTAASVVGIMARSGDTTTGSGGNGTGYLLRYRQFHGIELCRMDSAVPTVLAVLNASDPTGDITLTLTVSGTSITGTVAGNLSGTQTVTDATYASAGFVGIQSGAACTTTTGLHLTSITATDAGGGPSPPIGVYKHARQAVKRASYY